MTGINQVITDPSALILRWKPCSSDTQVTAYFYLTASFPVFFFVSFVFLLTDSARKSAAATTSTESTSLQGENTGREKKALKSPAELHN